MTDSEIRKDITKLRKLTDELYEFEMSLMEKYEECKMQSNIEGALEALLIHD